MTTPVLQRRGGRLAVTTAVAGTVLIALGAFWLSFTALADLARRSGISEGQAWAWPLIVDGIIVVATVSVVALAGHRAAWYPWMLLAAGAFVSVTANALNAVIAAEADVPGLLAAAVAAVPPLVLLAITHLTVILTLPLVVVTVETGGTLTVTVDGAPFAPEAFAPAWRRSDFGRIMDRITDQRRTPVRVEVHESDGTSFTDILTPSPSRRTRPEPETAKTETALETPAAPRLVEVTAEGFIPGEDIGVAIIVTHTDASHTGRARALLEAAQFDASPTGEVVLIGRVCGNYEIVRHP